MRSLIEYFLTAEIPDLSAAGSHWVPVPDGGRVVKVTSVLEGVITTPNATIDFEIGGTKMTNGGSTSTLTIAFSGSAAGDVDEAEFDGANDVAEGGSIEIVITQAAGAAARANLVFVIARRG